METILFNDNYLSALEVKNRVKSQIENVIKFLDGDTTVDILFEVPNPSMRLTLDTYRNIKMERMLEIIDDIFSSKRKHHVFATVYRPYLMIISLEMSIYVIDINDGDYVTISKMSGGETSIIEGTTFTSILTKYLKNNIIGKL